ncbi:MAG: hypothetical protein GEU75_11820 [Dehalococcoidia bacterium]|nr:hypothetical protein [Dehalococcoidia bacterium]
MKRGRPPTQDILTPREWEVLELLRAGLTNDQIAERLGISYDGAKFHVSEIITKLGVRTRYEAAAWRPSPGRRWQWMGLAVGLKKTALEAGMKTLGALPLAAAAGALGLLVIGLLFMQARQQSSASTAVGKIAYVQDGDIWVKHLPNGPVKQITHDGLNSAPKWSPSGDWLSYRSYHKDGDAGGLRSWVIRQDGSDERFVDHTFVAWSPNEDLLAFMAWDSVASRDEIGELVVERPDGSGRYRVLPPVDHSAIFTTGLSYTRTPWLSWSPDGRWLAFTETVTVVPRDTDGYCDCSSYVTLNRVPADGRSSAEVFYRGDLDVELATWDGWSADGRFYLLATRPSTSGGANYPWGPLIAAPVDGSTPRPSEAMLHWNDVSAIARSLDGRSLAIVEGESRASWQDKRITLYAPGTGRLSPLTEPDVTAISPAWSPSGSQITYTAAPNAPGIDTHAGAAGVLAERRVWVMDSDGTNHRQLTDDPRYRDENPRWSADGKQILFARIDLEAETPDLSLWLLQVESGELEQVVGGLEVIDGGEGFLWLEDRQFDYWRKP